MNPIKRFFLRLFCRCADYRLYQIGYGGEYVAQCLKCGQTHYQRR